MEWLTVTVGLAAIFVVALWLYLTRNRSVRCIEITLTPCICKSVMLEKQD